MELPRAPSTFRGLTHLLPISPLSLFIDVPTMRILVRSAFIKKPSHLSSNGFDFCGQLRNLASRLNSFERAVILIG